MDFRHYRDKLERSIKVVDLPNDYNSDFVIGLLKKVGKVTDTIKGQNDMIITYSSPLEKELSQMYNGCPIKGNKNLRLEDPTSFDLQKNEPKIYSPNISTRTTSIDGGSANRFLNQSKDSYFPTSLDGEKRSLGDLGHEGICKY